MTPIEHLQHPITYAPRMPYAVPTNPASRIELTLAIEDEHRAGRHAARYPVNASSLQCGSRYNNVDPANRLIADTLE